MKNMIIVKCSVERLVLGMDIAKSKYFLLMYLRYLMVAWKSSDKN